MSLIFGIILGAAFVIFALQNLEPVMVTFLGWGFEGSLAFIIIAALLAGIVMSLLFSLPSFIDSMMVESKLKDRNKVLKEELDTHKVMLDDAQQKIKEAENTTEKIIITKL